MYVANSKHPSFPQLNSCTQPRWPLSTVSGLVSFLVFPAKDYLNIVLKHLLSSICLTTLCSHMRFYNVPFCNFLLLQFEYVPPKFKCYELDPRCGSIGRWHPRGVFQSEGHSPRERLIPLLPQQVYRQSWFLPKR